MFLEFLKTKKAFALLAGLLIIGAGALYWIYESHRPKYFLVLSGGRTGSTWLVSMLNELTHSELQEIMWKQFIAVEQFQIAIDHDDMHIKEKLQEKNADRGLTTFGSKLIFSNVIYPKSILAEIGTYLRHNQDIKLLFLYRNYYDLFLSWYCRGAYHDTDHPCLSQKGSGCPPPTRIFLLNTPGADNEEIKRQYEACSENKIAISFTDGIGKLLALFCTDLEIITQCLEASGGKYFAVDYRDITKMFRDIVRFCKIKTTDDDITYVLDHPITRKLKSLDGYVYPREPFMKVAQVLDKKLRDVLNRKKRMQDFLFIDEKAMHIVFYDHELKDIFGKYIPLAKVLRGLGTGMLLPAEGRE